MRCGASTAGTSTPATSKGADSAAERFDCDYPDLTLKKIVVEVVWKADPPIGSPRHVMPRAERLQTFGVRPIRSKKMKVRRLQLLSTE
jgi:hypothetical protein